MQSRFILSVLSLVLGGCSAPENDPAIRGAVQLYKTPLCSCCANYVRYLRNHNYTVEVTDLLPSQLDEQRHRFGVPAKLTACHTSIIEGYIVEGHVPVAAIDQLIITRPQTKGISVPGMPAHSPGMGAPDGKPLPVYYLSSDADDLHRFDYSESKASIDATASTAIAGEIPVSLPAAVSPSQSHHSKELMQ